MLSRISHINPRSQEEEDEDGKGRRERRRRREKEKRGMVKEGSRRATMSGGGVRETGRSVSGSGAVTYTQAIVNEGERFE